MLFFLKILLAHILGDFVFQSEKWVKDKEKRKVKSKHLYFHVAIHFLLLLVVLQFQIEKYWLGFIVIIVSHYLIDLTKLYFQHTKTKRRWFFIDQLAHLIVLIFIVNLYNPFTITVDDFFNEKTLFLLIAISILTQVSSIVIKLIIAQWNPENKEDNDDSLTKAGRYIGVLERLFVFAFVITNHWEAIGFLLAAKSVFRFGDLKKSKERKLTEYILIGTLLSFGFAILTGILYLYAIELI